MCDGLMVVRCVQYVVRSGGRDAGRGGGRCDGGRTGNGGEVRDVVDRQECMAGWACVRTLVRALCVVC